MKNFPLLQNVDAVIEEVVLYRYDSTVLRHFSFGTWRSRQHAFLKISTNGYHGWGENVISVNQEDVNLQRWGSFFEDLKGLTVSQAIRYVESKLTDWGDRRCEMAEMALIDLAGKIQGKSALEILHLNDQGSVPGVYVILEDDVNRTKELIKQGFEQKLTSHIKLKLFGDLSLDSALIQVLREGFGESAYIIGDVNAGYRVELSEKPVEDVAVAMKELYRKGLNACEDPAMLTNQQWVELQSQVEPLALLPDYPMRPSASAIRTLLPGMGHIYNIHPGCTGSILAAVRLGQKIKQKGGQLMIGDDSLLGPACTGWQQLAIGLSADWVEAIEKPGESDGFLQSVQQQATLRPIDSHIIIDKKRAGFGLEIDEAILKDTCVCLVNL
ncbi:MAG: hypothetical protein GX347_03365 [Epulopiscium sp.]|nr:hypothetical protein [Candidatus Epulonipiscium sp.]